MDLLYIHAIKWVGGLLNFKNYKGNRRRLTHAMIIMKALARIGDCDFRVLGQVHL
jgi:hypothetical protein